MPVKPDGIDKPTDCICCHMTRLSSCRPTIICEFNSQKKLYASTAGNTIELCKIKGFSLEAVHIAGQIPPLGCHSLTQLSILPLERQLSSLSCRLAGPIRRASMRAVACCRAAQACGNLPLRLPLDLPSQVCRDGLGTRLKGSVM